MTCPYLLTCQLNATLRCIEYKECRFYNYQQGKDAIIYNVPKRWHPKVEVAVK